MNTDHWSRLLLGSIFLLSGVNFFWRFLPHQELTPLSEEGAQFIKALNDSGFVMTLEKSLELFSSVLLLSNVAVPLALIILAPLVINIFFFHLFLSPGLHISILLLGLMTHLTYCRRKYLKGLFK